MMIIPMPVTESMNLKRSCGHFADGSSKNMKMKICRDDDSDVADEINHHFFIQTCLGHFIIIIWINCVGVHTYVCMNHVTLLYSILID